MINRKSYLSRAIFSNAKIFDNVKISFLDVGARGDLPPPWLQLEARFPQRINVAGFETDTEELAQLKKKFPSRNYFPVGLGKEDGSADFFLNNGKSSSSLYPPNESQYGVFRDKHSSGRLVDRKLQVEISKLDSLDLSSLRSAFVKLDVQGAELDILIGGKKFFENNAIGFSAETWTYEIYKDQPLMHDVMRWASENNYDLYCLEETGRWDFNAPMAINERGAPVCIDLVFFRSFSSFMNNQPTLDDIISFALILDLWGFSSRSLTLLGLHADQSEVCEIAKFIKRSQERRFFTRHKVYDVIDKILIRMGLTPRFPPVHD